MRASTVVKLWTVLDSMSRSKVSTLTGRPKLQLPPPVVGDVIVSLWMISPLNRSRWNALCEPTHCSKSVSSSVRTEVFVDDREEDEEKAR